MSTIALSTGHRLDPDTQAVLLLCGWFGQPPAAGAPLSIAEYNRLAEWLQRHNLSPRDLFGGEWQRQEGMPLSVSRLQALLDRGVALALAVENWTNQGLWVISRGDAKYPHRLKAYLGRLAPPILYGAGANKDHIPGSGLAVVGARAADDAALAYTSGVARACAGQAIPIISGGARGVDSTAMEAALAEGGEVIGMLADSLARAASSKHYRQALIEGRLTLLSPFNPLAGFSAGNAMARNKYIYALAEWGLIVSSGANEGGTWAGAVEALRTGRIPVFVRLQGDVPEGNRRLAEMGAQPFPEEPWTDLAVSLKVAGQAPKEEDGATQALTNSRSRRLKRETGQLALVSAPAQEARLELAPATQVFPEPTPEEAVARASTTQGALEAPQTAPLQLSIFDAVWPVLIAHLQVPRTLQELATALEVRPAQLQDWLDRVVQEGWACKLARPVRYVAQPSLFQERGQNGVPTE